MPEMQYAEKSENAGRMGGRVRGDSVNRVYRSINKPALVFGIEKRMFFLAMMAGLLVFQSFNSFFAGVGVTVLLAIGARILTHEDSQMPVIVLAAIKLGLYEKTTYFDAY